jgi:hypothetical protein
MIRFAPGDWEGRGFRDELWSLPPSASKRFVVFSRTRFAMETSCTHCIGAGLVWDTNQPTET